MSASLSDFRGEPFSFTPDYWDEQRERARLRRIAELAIAKQEATETNQGEK